jgi:hypothetical protein
VFDARPGTCVNRRERDIHAEGTWSASIDTCHGWRARRSPVAIQAFASHSPASRAAASQASGAINAVDFVFENPATGGTDATINVGGTVTFAYPTGGSAHNVDFSAAQPTSCVQTAGAPSTVVPRLARTSSTAMPMPTPSGAAASHVKLACHQRGEAVRGSIVVAHAGSRLSVAVLAKPSALNRKAPPGSVSAASRKRSTPEKRRSRSPVKIAVTPPGGKPFRATKKVTLKRE